MIVHPLAEKLWFVPLTELNKRDIKPEWCWSLFDILDAFSEYLYDHNVPEDEPQANLLEIFDCFIIEVTEEIQIGTIILKAAATYDD